MCTLKNYKKSLSATLSIHNCNGTSFFKGWNWVFTDEKMFTVAVLITHKIIWCMQLNSTTSMPVIFCHASHFQQVCKVSIAVLKLVYTNRILNETGSINEKCCWCKNCCQWPAELLETCFSSSKTVHQRIMLMTRSSFCAVGPHSLVLICGHQLTALS